MKCNKTQTKRLRPHSTANIFIYSAVQGIVQFCQIQRDRMVRFPIPASQSGAGNTNIDFVNNLGICPCTPAHWALFFLDLPCTTHLSSRWYIKSWIVSTKSHMQYAKGYACTMYQTKHVTYLRLTPLCRYTRIRRSMIYCIQLPIIY